MTAPTVAITNPISRIDPPLTSLNAVTSTGAGTVLPLSAPCYSASLQVSFTGGSPTVKVTLEGSMDGTTWGTLATFDTAASGVTGGFVSAVSQAPVIAIRANLVTLSGGTSPTVTAVIAARGGE